VSDEAHRSESVTREPNRYLSGAIARLIYQFRVDQLPAAVITIARQHLLDTVGCCLAATDLDTSSALGAWLVSEGGAEQATAIGVDRRLPAAQAAFMNGLLARSLEYDDMAMPDLHPSGVIAPVVLAVGEWQRASGAELLAAMALGLELLIRIGRAGYDPDARTSRFLQRGQDASAICGVVAGAAVAARLFGLDADRIADAIGIAVSLASGSLEANRSGGTIKRFQSGWAAKSAVHAAGLAKAGVGGPAQAFEGRYGFYRCFLDGAFDAAMLADGLGTRWEVSSLRFKPYPSNYYTHAGIDAALAFSRRGIRPEQIRSAELGVATPMLHTMGEPLARKQAPKSAYEAKFSGPYTVASAIIGGTGLGLGIDDFTDPLVREPRRATLMQRIAVVANPRCDAIFPEQAPAVLAVVTEAGERLLEEVMVNRGGPARPLDDGELAGKFEDCAKRTLPPHAVGSLRRAIEDLPVGDAVTLAKLLRAVRQ
jgi:2-methylcitrate dehydratase PrpD